MSEPYSKHNSPRTNPCIEEAQASYKCLADSNYDRSKCTKFFIAYRECKIMMNKVKSERRSQGLLPVPKDWQGEMEKHRD